MPFLLVQVKYLDLREFIRFINLTSYFLGALRDNISEEDLEQYFAGGDRIDF